MRPVCEGSSCQTGSISDTCQRHASLFVSFHKAQPLPFDTKAWQEWFIHGAPVRNLFTERNMLATDMPLSLSPSRKLSLCPLPPSLCPLPPSDVSQKTHVNHVKAHVNEDLPKRLPKRGGMVFCLLVYVRKELTCLSLFTVSEICV